MSPKAVKKKTIPFDFVLDLLEDQDPQVRPMFGCHAIYIKGKLYLILRDKRTELRDNGVWLATSKEHHQSLRKDFPSMRSLELFGTGVTSWQNLPANSFDFEGAVNHACNLILKGDPRIGKIPQPKSKTRKKTKAKAK